MNSTATKIVSLFSKRTKRKPRRRIEEPQQTPAASRARIEGKDAFLFGGLALAGYGVWQIYPPSAMILVGGVFFAIGVLWYMGGTKNGTS